MEEEEKGTREDWYDRLREWVYYLIIGIMSFISVAFLPMLNTELGMGPKLPDSNTGWIVWWATKIFTAILNVMIFHCFMKQAIINVAENEKYIKALEDLGKIKNRKILKPRSPSKWNSSQYLFKGLTIALGTIISAIALEQALLSWDLTVFLANLFTVIMGLVFGYLQMRKAEIYWTEEFPRWVNSINKEVC